MYSTGKIFLIPEDPQFRIGSRVYLWRNIKPSKVYCPLVKWNTSFNYKLTSSFREHLKIIALETFILYFLLMCRFCKLF